MSGRLTAKEAENAVHPKTHIRPIRIHDGDGLYLQVAVAGSKSWILRYMLDGKAREMGLGGYGKPAKAEQPQVGLTLADARVKAAEARVLLQRKIDPIRERQTRRRQEIADQRKAEESTFRAIAEEMVKSRKAEWKNAKHIQQWENTLATYAYPKIGSLPVAEIRTEDVLRVLRPIWHAKPETASRLRGRMERILAYAKSIGLREGDNPAAWRGHLSESLPSPRRVQARLPGHHSALPFTEISAFIAALDRDRSSSSLALKFLILTAARTNEVLGARWREFDLDAKAWTVPPNRMKSKREHRVPLSDAAMRIILDLEPLSRGADSFVFPGRSAGSGLSQMALLMHLRRMNGVQPGETAPWRDGRTGEPITAHGFRSTFRDWCGEITDFAADLAEAALAHSIRDRTVAAYARGTLFDKRRELMAAWGLFCACDLNEGRAVDAAPGDAGRAAA